MTRAISIPLVLCGLGAALCAVMGAMYAPALFWGGLMVAGVIIACVGLWWMEG